MKFKFLNDEEFQEQLSFVMTVHICFMQCKNMLVSSSDIFYQYNSLLNMAAMVLVLVLYLDLLVRGRMYRQFNRNIFFTVCIIALWFFVSHLVDNKLFVETEFPYSYVRRQLTTFLVYCLPLFVTSSMLNKPKLLLRKFYKSSNIVFLVSTVSVIFYTLEGGKVIERGYSMSFGNQMLLNCIFCLFSYLRKHFLWDLIKFILTVFYILAAGSRGPLVSIGVLIIFAVLKTLNTKKKIIKCAVGILFVAVFSLFYQNILQALYDILQSHGITSRTLYMILAGNLNYDSGRAQYHEELFNSLNQSPLLGLGAFGGEKTVGLSHSLYIDILANFGYVFGVLFMIWLAYRLFRQVYYHRNDPRTELLWMMSIVLFPRGFFDETFWGAWPLWIIFGIILGKSYSMSDKSEGEKYGCVGN